jgi:hypothetical protein
VQCSKFMSRKYLPDIGRSAQPLETSTADDEDWLVLFLAVYGLLSVTALINVDLVMGTFMSASPDILARI